MAKRAKRVSNQFHGKHTVKSSGGARHDRKEGVLIILGRPTFMSLNGLRDQVFDHSVCGLV